MALLPLAILAGAALLLGLLVGGWAGWLGRGRQPIAEGKTNGLQGSHAADGSCLWDPHACLNALNRCIISAPVALAEDDPLYAVSDHLRLLAQLSQSGGWISPHRLQEWLEALVALQADASVCKVCSVALPENRVQQLQIGPLGTALLPLLRQARPLAGVSIEAGDMRLHGGTGQAASLVLRLRVSEGSKAHTLALDEAAQALREWEIQVVCECTLVH